MSQYNAKLAMQHKPLTEFFLPTDPIELFGQREADGTNKSQRQRVLDVLMDRRYHSCKEFLKMGIAQYGARISELKELGHKIKNEPQPKGTAFVLIQ